MAMMRASFIVRTLSNCRQFVRVTWGDGAKSTFPNMWLRSSIRDEPFFDQKSCSYQHSHLDFLTKGASISYAQQSKDEDNVEVQWEDHTSVFDASWLRAQDLSISSSLLPSEYQQVLWGHEVKIPEFDYSHRGEQVMDCRGVGRCLVAGGLTWATNWCVCMSLLKFRCSEINSGAF